MLVELAFVGLLGLLTLSRGFSSWGLLSEFISNSTGLTTGASCVTA